MTNLFLCSSSLHTCWVLQGVALVVEVEVALNMEFAEFFYACKASGSSLHFQHVSNGVKLSSNRHPAVLGATTRLD